MTTYYCKCGRIVRKSTGADNTGNRLEGYAPGHECFGCPYVLPWGENRYEAGKGYALEVKGYECRMSQSLEYASRFSGSVKDKCTCSIVSLDFDFLERVSNWISATYPGREIFGYFSRSTIRPVEYSINGRYRMTVTCSQNKAGMAAKAALLEQFFNPDGSRRDMTPEQEQEKILNDIKAATKEKETTPCAASPNPQSPTPTAAPSQSPGPGPVEVVGEDPEDIARWRAEGAAQEGALQTIKQAVETCELLLQKAAEELPRLPNGQYRTAMQSVCKLYNWLGRLIALKDKEDQNVL